VASGTNTVNFTKGTGVADVFLNGGNGVISFGAGVSAQDVYLQDNNGNGDLTIQIQGDTTDRITVHNDLVYQSGTLTSAVKKLQFADGSMIDLVFHKY
jgi:hypothetical protein